MSWSKKTENGMFIAEETVTLADTSTAYTSEIDFIKPSNNGFEKEYFTVVTDPSANPATTLDVNLVGVDESGGTKFTLKSTLVTQYNGGNAVAAAVIDMKAYPAPYYYIALVSGGNDSSATCNVKIIV